LSPDGGRGVGTLNDDESRFQEGRRLEDKGRLDEAREIYESLIGSELSSEALNRLGVLDVYSGDVQRAEARFRQALVENRRSAPALSNLGNIYLERGEMEEAEKLYREAIEIDRDLASPHQNLAVILKRQGNVGGMAAEMKTYQRLRRRQFFARGRPGGPRGGLRSGCMPVLVVAASGLVATLWILHLA